MRQPWVRGNACFLASIVACALALTVPQWLVHAKHTPPVGLYIGIMGLTAAIASLFRLKRQEKFGWILFMTILVIAEIRTLYAADKDQLDRFNQISGSLESTKNGLATTATELHESMSSNQQQFEETARKFGAVITLQKKTIGELQETQEHFSEELAKAPLSQMSNTQLAGVAHQAAAQMREYVRLYSYQDSTIDNKYWSKLTSSSPPTPSQRQQLLAKEKLERQELTEEYDQAVASLAKNANLIRSAMLTKVLPADQKRVSEANPGSHGSLYQLAGDADHLERIAALMLASAQN